MRHKSVRTLVLFVICLFAWWLSGVIVKADSTWVDAKVLYNYFTCKVCGECVPSEEADLYCNIQESDKNWHEYFKSEEYTHSDCFRCTNENEVFRVSIPWKTATRPIKWGKYVKPIEIKSWEIRDGAHWHKNEQDCKNDTISCAMAWHSTVYRAPLKNPKKVELK